MLDRGEGGDRRREYERLRMLGRVVDLAAQPAEQIRAAKLLSLDVERLFDGSIVVENTHREIASGVGVAKQEVKQPPDLRAVGPQRCGRIGLRCGVRLGARRGLRVGVACWL